jgi:hypothetical protein
MEEEIKALNKLFYEYVSATNRVDEVNNWNFLSNYIKELRMKGILFETRFPKLAEVEKPSIPKSAEKLKSLANEFSQLKTSFAKSQNYRKAEEARKKEVQCIYKFNLLFDLQNEGFTLENSKFVYHFCGTDKIDKISKPILENLETFKLEKLRREELGRRSKFL